MWRESTRHCRASNPHTIAQTVPICHTRLKAAQPWLLANATLARRDPTVDRARNVWQGNLRQRQEMARARIAFPANTRRSNRLLHALGAVNARHSPAQCRPERFPTGAGITVTTPTVSGCFLLRPASPLRLSIQSLATTSCMCISVRRHRVAQRRSWRSFPAAKLAPAHTHPRQATHT